MSDGRLTITDAVDRAIRQHGQETYPHECCGALIGKDGHVSDVLALANTTEEGPRRRFLVRPSDYRHGRSESATELGGELTPGSITRIPTIRRGRRSSIWIVRGRRSRTSSSP